MSRKCLVFGCTNTAKNSPPNISLHTFPLPKDPERRNKWLEITGYKEWELNTNSKICSAHFAPNDFARTHIYYGTNVLSHNAVPRQELTAKRPANANRKTNKAPPENIYVISEAKVTQVHDETPEIVQKMAPNVDHIGYTIKIESDDEEEKNEPAIDCNICRICLKKENLVSLFVKFNTDGNVALKESNSSYADLIEEITTLKVLAADNLPQMICYDCKYQVLNAYHLKRRILDTDDYLKRQVNLVDCNQQEILIDLKLNDDASLNQLDPIKTECGSENENEEETDNFMEVEENDELVPISNLPETTDTRFVCRTCKPMQSFTNFYSLQRHEQDIHSNFKYCRKCHQKFFKEGSSYEDHQAICNHYTCIECKKKNRTQIAHIKHMMTDHAPKEKSKLKVFLESHDLYHVCKSCERQFYTEDQLKTHNIRCGELNHECYICNRIFNSNKSKFDHVKSDHAKLDTKCKKCSFQSTSMIRFEIHMKSHIRDNTFICFFCGVDAKNWHSLHDHIESLHEVKAFLCDFCGENFKEKSDVLKHMLSSHL